VGGVATSGNNKPFIKINKYRGGVNMSTEGTPASLERGRDAMESLVTSWAGLAVEAERGGDAQLQEITTRGADLALFRTLLGEVGAVPSIKNPKAYVRTLFNFADAAEIEYGRDGVLAKQTRDCLFKLMEALGAIDADSIISAFADAIAAMRQIDDQLEQLSEEYEAHTKGGE